MNNIEYIKERLRDVLVEEYSEYETIINERINKLEVVLYNYIESKISYDNKCINQGNIDLVNFETTTFMNSLFDDKKEIMIPRLSNLVSDSRKITTSHGIFDGEFKSLLFFSKKPSIQGLVDYYLTHEFIHIIDAKSVNSSKFNIGFLMSFANNPSKYNNISNNKCEASKRNSYNKNLLHLEIFDETIVDMQTIEIIEKLRTNKKYILEPNELWRDNYFDFSTHGILRNAITPFYNKFKDLITKAKITSDLSIITNNISVEDLYAIAESLNRLKFFLLEVSRKKITDSEFLIKKNITENNLVKIYKKNNIL